MTTLENVRKLLETHRLQPKTGGLMEKCTGCVWIGFTHAEHVAELVIDAVVPLIGTVEELAAIEVGTNDMAGAVIKAIGHPSWGEIYEQNTDGTWGLLESSQSDDQSRVSVEDIGLPALLLWQPAKES